MGVNEDLRDASISHAIYLERFKTSTVNAMLKVLSETDRELSYRIASRYERGLSTARLERLLRDIQGILHEGQTDFTDALRRAAREFARYESDLLIRRVDGILPIDWTFSRPTLTQIWAATTSRPFDGHLLGDSLGTYERRSRDLISSELRRGWIAGDSIDTMVQRVRGTRSMGYRDGIIETKRRSATALVRTFINHVHSTARDLTYQENGDLVKGVQWVSTLDGRTSLICISLDGKVFPVDEGIRPPAHWNCRSTTVPVIKSWRELGLDIDELEPGSRASMDGQVPETETYGAWLKKKPAAFQREVLGDARYKAWKAGEVPIDRFADNGKVLSLQELGLKEAG